MSFEEFSGLVILGLLAFLALKRYGEKKREMFEKRKW